MGIKQTVEHRYCGTEGIDNLYWIIEDKGAWSGPLEDWKQDKDNFMKHVKKFDYVVQAGGCCGMYPRFYGNYFKNVYTFEPDPNSYYCLELNCQGEKYNMYNVALGDRQMTVKMNVRNKRNIGMHKIIKEGDGGDGLDVKMIPLDKLNLPGCDLLHLDLEGYEENALKGARELIDKYEPVIITERASGAKYLKDIGYEDAGLSLRMDSVFLKHK